MPNPLSRLLIPRRTFFSGLGGTAAAVSMASLGRADETAAPKRVLRVAHLTDVHVQPELHAAEGMAACLRHIQSLADRPELILSGGDHVMDCIQQPRERTKVQWDLWKSVAGAETEIPIRACLGNHDIWGWNKTKCGATGNEPDYGKNWGREVLGLARPYYSFDQAGWHFIALDGVQPREIEGAFCAYLDEDQFAWLEQDLANVPATTSILIWSHIPIISAMATLINPERPLKANLSIQAGHVHADAPRILKLFANYPNVKACLSGHLHRVEHIEMKGLHFHCNGAVSGAWWKGKNDGFAEGYALIDLFDNGSYRLEYVPFGWRAG